MADYNMLFQVIHDDRRTAWRFRVKIVRAASFYSLISIDGADWRYILADEEGTKMELTIYAGTTRADKLTHLETLEGRWVEIFGVCVVLDVAGFRAANSRFRLLPTYYTTVNIINPLNNRHYMEFRNIHDIPHIRNRNFPVDIMGVVFKTEAPMIVFYIRDNIESEIKCVATGERAIAFRDGFDKLSGRGEVIVVLKMWRIYKIFHYFEENELWLQNEGWLSDFMFHPELRDVEEFKQPLKNSDPYVRRYRIMGPLYTFLF